MECEQQDKLMPRSRNHAQRLMTLLCTKKKVAMVWATYARAEASAFPPSACFQNFSPICGRDAKGRYLLSS
jgi:hypothetical protein